MDRPAPRRNVSAAEQDRRDDAVRAPEELAAERVQAHPDQSRRILPPPDVRRALAEQAPVPPAATQLDVRTALRERVARARHDEEQLAAARREWMRGETEVEPVLRP